MYINRGNWCVAYHVTQLTPSEHATKVAWFLIIVNCLNSRVQI